MTIHLKHTRRRIDAREQWLEWRKRNIGASDVAALFGVHPYATPLQLWARHSGKAPPREDQDNAAMRRGRIFENAVISAYQEERPSLYLMLGQDYHEIPALRLGATPDAWCVDRRGDGSRELVQIKTVTPGKFDNEWQYGPPIHILMQLQAEMLVTQSGRGRIVAMVMDGFSMPIHEYCYQADTDYHAGLIVAVKRFWTHVAEDIAPDALAGDQETLAQLHPEHKAGPTIALGGMVRVREAVETLKAAEQEMSTLKKRISAQNAIICEALGNHSRGTLPGWVIKWTEVPPVDIKSHVRKGYRRLTVTKERG